MSDSDDENIVRYGTQLEPYEEDRTCAMPKTNAKLKGSEKKKLRKLLAANVNINKAREVCHLSWPEICQVIPGIEHITPESTLNQKSNQPPKKTKKKHPKVRVRPMELLSREIEPNQGPFWRDPCSCDNSGARIVTRTSQDRGTSPNYWKSAPRNMPSPVHIEYETNEESLHQPYRPPLTYTREVLPTTQPNDCKPSWEPLVDCGEPNFRKRDRSPTRSRHDVTHMDFRSNNSYERTQLKYSDTDTLQVRVQDGLRAVNRHYSDNSDVNPFSDQPYKALKTSSECSASLNYWLEPDRPSRLGLRTETHPPERAIDDKKLKVTKYHKNSWESSVNLDYRQSDRPLRNGLRVETETMATICINDESDDEYRGRTYEPRTRVDEDRGHFEFSEPNRRETTSLNGCHSRWDQRPENEITFEDNDKNVKKDAGPICVAISNVTPMTNLQMTLVLQSINHAIVRIGVQGAGPMFSGSIYKTGWILMNCENHMSRVWLEMEVPSLKPWPEAILSVMPPGDVQESRHSLSILIPNNEGVNVPTALELLRVQNPGLNTENWEVITVKKINNCQVVLLTVDEASFEALRLLKFSANLGTNKVGFLVMSGPSVPSAFVNSSTEDVPLASSSAYTERESNSIACPHENTTTTVSRKRRRQLRNVRITHSQTSGHKPSLPDRRVLLPTPGGSARPTTSLPQVNASVSSPERRSVPGIGLAQASRLQSQTNSRQSKKRWYPIPDQSYPSSIGLRGNFCNW